MVIGPKFSPNILFVFHLIFEVRDTLHFRARCVRRSHHDDRGRYVGGAGDGRDHPGRCFALHDPRLAESAISVSDAKLGRISRLCADDADA